MVALVVKKVILWLALSVVLASVMAVNAAIPVKNQNPFAQLSGLPILTSAKLMDEGAVEFQLIETISNLWSESDKKDEHVFLDGESYVSSFQLRLGLESAQLTLLLPYVAYRGGFLDGFIEGFHKAFSLPNADREKVKRNQLLFLYQDREQLVVLDEAAEGVGDAQIGISYSLLATVGSSHALHLQAKLPTGNERYWLGSGSSDVALFSSHYWQAKVIDIEFQQGVLWMQGSDLIPGQQKKWAVFSGLNLSYALSQSWGVSLQYDYHSALYKNSYHDQLGDGQMGTVALELNGEKLKGFFSVVEDLEVNSAADVSYQIGLTLHFL